MVWTIDGPIGYESAKIASHVVRYCGEGPKIDLGCGPYKVWPSFIGMDFQFIGHPHGPNFCGDITDLSMFSDNYFQVVFSSHALEDSPRERTPIVLTEWNRVLKVGGYLILYLPSANLYPKCGEPGANKDHKWDIYPGDVEKILREEVNGGNWTLLESEQRNGTNEYSLFIVVRKEAEGHGWKEDVWQRNPEGKKRALIVRYGGAIGDMVQCASLFPGLKEAGYHITLNTTPLGKEMLKLDPYVDEWLLQETDFVPNEALGPYWESLAERYDHIINLCESVEGAFLTIVGRLQWSYSDNSRRRLVGKKNYLEYQHDIADIPYIFKPAHYPSEDEVKWAKAKVAELSGNNPLVAIVCHGSSLHKVHPDLQTVISWLLVQSPCSIAVLGNQPEGGPLMDMIRKQIEKSESAEELNRVHFFPGTMTRREAMAFVMHASCVVGPETGLLNLVAFSPMPKVVYLSHSSKDNLTKHWVNTIALTPDTKICPCYPCHRMHNGWETCHRSEKTGAALCADGVSADRIFVSIALSLGANVSDKNGKKLTKRDFE